MLLLKSAASFSNDRCQTLDDVAEINANHAYSVFCAKVGFESCERFLAASGGSVLAATGALIEIQNSPKLKEGLKVSKVDELIKAAEDIQRRRTPVPGDSPALAAARAKEYKGAVQAQDVLEDVRGKKPSQVTQKQLRELVRGLEAAEFGFVARQLPNLSFWSKLGNLLKYAGVALAGVSLLAEGVLPVSSEECMKLDWSKENPPLLKSDMQYVNMSSLSCSVTVKQTFFDKDYAEQLDILKRSSRICSALIAKPTPKIPKEQKKAPSAPQDGSGTPG
jgi:hypothetical protein